MNQLIAHQSKDGFGREIFSLSLQSLDSLPQKLELPSPHFVLFLACDARETTDAVVEQFARNVIDIGAVYVCTWGFDCERVHDGFDDVATMLEIDENRSLSMMTTWHDEDSLDEVLWFVLHSGRSDDRYADTCRSVLAVSVANDDWEAQIRRRLFDLNGLNADVLGEN